MILKPVHNEGKSSLDGSTTCSSEHEVIAPMVIHTKLKRCFANSSHGIAHVLLLPWFFENSIFILLLSCHPPLCAGRLSFLFLALPSSMIWASVSLQTISPPQTSQTKITDRNISNTHPKTPKTITTLGPTSSFHQWGNQPAKKSLVSHVMELAWW